jgi:cold shock CspA family protein
MKSRGVMRLRERGYVRSFSIADGWGFVVTQGGDHDVFLHITAMQDRGTPKRGDRVELSVARMADGTRRASRTNLTTEERREGWILRSSKSAKLQVRIALFVNVQATHLQGTTSPPYVDDTLEDRVEEAHDEWRDAAQEAVDEQVDADLIADLRADAADKLEELRAENLHDGIELGIAAGAEGTIKVLAVKPGRLSNAGHAFGACNGTDRV